MEAKEFFENVEKSLNETKGDDVTGVGYFIQDMDELFDEWYAEGKH